MTNYNERLDPKVFKDITGIDISAKEQPSTINIDGKDYEVTDELTEVLKNLKETA